MPNTLQVSNPNLWAPTVAELGRIRTELVRLGFEAIALAIEAGQILSRVKNGGTVKHGEWLPWIEEFSPFPERTVRRYISYFDNKDLILEGIKSAMVADFADADALISGKLGNGSNSNEPAKLHEPNFHSQFVKIKQNGIGLFNHWIQRRPLAHWDTEELFDTSATLHAWVRIADQVDEELAKRSDVPSTH